MKRIIILALSLAFALSLIACGGTPPPTPTPAVTLAPVKASGRVVAEGKVVPVQSAALSFQTSGAVAQIPVKIGDSVNVGQVLLSLDTRELDLRLAQAEATLAGAQAKYNQLKRGPTADDLNAAQQNVKSAQAAYDGLLHPPQNDILALKSDLDSAKAQVDRAQAAYDRIGGDSNPFSGMTAERAALQSAYLEYQKALALYNGKLNPSDAEIQQALAAVQTAKSNLAKLTPTSDDLAAAQAEVNANQAARDLAAQNLNLAKLTSPLAGTVVSLDPQVGESITAGTPVVRVADTRNFQIESTDLTEINIVNVKVGDPASVTLDAIPDLELTGKVASITGYGENRQGDIVYTVVVKLDTQDPRVRWNMTAKLSLSK